jgi:hypothetical protein
LIPQPAARRGERRRLPCVSRSDTHSSDTTMPDRDAIKAPAGHSCLKCCVRCDHMVVFSIVI